MKNSTKLLLLALLAAAALTFAACQKSETPPAQSGTEVNATGAATEAVTEAQTEYTIEKPDEVGKMLTVENTCNVKTYGAVGDGKTDDTQAVLQAFADAYLHCGTVYFPAGEYRVTQSVVLQKNDAVKLAVVGDNATLIGDKSLSGAMLQCGLKYNFTVAGLDFRHEGQGSCIDSLFLRATYCTFTASESNTADLVIFHGSDCRVDRCTFTTTCATAYALTYVKMDDEISINDFITDNVFAGIGRGVTVGDGQKPEDGRCEGLKISGNHFRNTGDEQIRVSEILHINIARNEMKGCTGAAIVLCQRGHGADGVYINDNTIENNGIACIASVGKAGDYISMVNINNNTLTGGQYGVYDPILFNKAYLRENTFSGQTVSGFYTGKAEMPGSYMVFDNRFTEGETVNSFDFHHTGTVRFRGNVIGETNVIPTAIANAVAAGCVSESESGENMTRHDPWTDDEPDNRYEGETDPEIPNEGEDETILPTFAVVSPDAVDAPLYSAGDVLEGDAYILQTELSARFVATAHWNKFTVVCPSWGDSVGSIHVAIYRWTGNYEETVQAAPLAQTDWVNYPDNGCNEMTFDALPAGEYLAVFSVASDKVSELAGFWLQKIENPVTRVYKNGSLCDGWEIKYLTLCYTETPEHLTWQATEEGLIQ